MAFHTQGSEDDMLSEINMIPLIDVMLVLLIVFMITVPVMQHAVDVTLPTAASQASPDRTEAIELSVLADGQYRWNGREVSDDELDNELTQAAQATPPPELHIRGDKNVRYERVAQAMAAAQRAGITQLGFITEP